MAVEYVECYGRWWGQQWDPTAQQFSWWLAAVDGSQLGHTIWRLLGTSVDVPVIMLDKFQQSWFLLWSSSPCRTCSGTCLVHFLDRVMDIPVGYFVGDAQCTLCRGPWSSTGPGSWYGVERLLLCNNRCCGRLSSRMLVRQWIHFLRLYLVGYGRISHIFYV